MTAHNLFEPEFLREELAKAQSRRHLKNLFHISRLTTVFAVASLAATAVLSSTISTTSYLDSLSASLPVLPGHTLAAHHNATAHHQTFAYANPGTVLGESTSNQPPNVASQVQSILNQYLQEGTFKGPKGDKGDKGDGLAPGFSGPNGMVQDGNGQTTSVIGGAPIVSYYPAVPSQNFTGTSLAGFGSLSAGTFASGNTTISGDLNVSGPVSASSLTSSGGATIAGAFSAGTSTLSTLTVSGPATFSGSTTIAGLTVTGLNQGLTQGSIAFQGASALSQDNANLFYDAINHRLGIGTTTPSQLLTVAGNAVFTGNVGIGTTNPGQTLQVNGTTQLGGGSTPTGVFGDGT